MLIFSLTNLSEIKEEIIDNCSTNEQSISTPINLSDKRRSSTCMSKRRLIGDSKNAKDSSLGARKKTKLDTDIQNHSNSDSMTNSDNISLPIEPQSFESMSLVFWFSFEFTNKILLFQSKTISNSRKTRWKTNS